MAMLPSQGLSPRAHLFQIIAPSIHSPQGPHSMKECNGHNERGETKTRATAIEEEDQISSFFHRIQLSFFVIYLDSQEFLSDPCHLSHL
jgi:hypothetical protein